jgi:hypothetical protein
MKSFSPRRSRSVHARPALVLALLAAMSLSACGGADEDGEQGASTSETRTSAPPTPPATTSGEQAAATGDGTPIRISAGETEITARLLDTATARDLAGQLPLTLTFRDHNSVEKTAPLPRELSLDGAPDGHDPTAGDIGYWAPDGDFVLYYDDDAPYFDGIVRIGELGGDVEPISQLPDGASVTIERAG